MKKKLRLVNIKRKLKAMVNASSDLLIDKLQHANSRVPISANKLLAMNKELQAASRRAK